MSETKTRAARKPKTDFARSIGGFVQAVDPGQLAARVAQKLNNADKDQVLASIKNAVRKVGQDNGCISVRSKDLLEAVFAVVPDLDKDLAGKAATLRSQIVFEPISSAGREPGQNWIVRLKSGEEVFLNEGPDGAGYYQLTFTRALAEGEEVSGAEVELSTDGSEEL